MSDRAPGERVTKQRHGLTLSNEAFDSLAELDAPAQAVPELAELFRSNPKLPEA